MEDEDVKITVDTAIKKSKIDYKTKAKAIVQQRIMLDYKRIKILLKR